MHACLACLHTLSLCVHYDLYVLVPLIFDRKQERSTEDLQSVGAALRQEVADEREIDAVGHEGVGQVAEEDDHDGQGAAAADGRHHGHPHQQPVLTTRKAKLE